MKRQTSKDKVRAIYPNALVAEDLDSNTNSYSSEWAATAKFIIGYFSPENDVDPNKVFKTTYFEIIGLESWRFLSGWQKSKLRAWNAAWQSIEQQMIRKLEQ